jgi:hypothetical protein
MKYSTLILSIAAVFAAGTVYAQNGGMSGPPDVAKVTLPASVPHVPAPKSTASTKVLLPPR